MRIWNEGRIFGCWWVFGMGKGRDELRGRAGEPDVQKGQSALGILDISMANLAQKKNRSRQMPL